MLAACGRPGLEDRTEPRGSGPSERVWRAGRRQREPGRATPWFARIWRDAHRGSPGAADGGRFFPALSACIITSAQVCAK